MNIRLTHRRAMGLAVLWALWLAAPAACAQETYKVTWFSLGRDAPSTGGVYSMRGSVGCTDVGPMSNGVFAVNEGGYCRLTGGLWRILIVPDISHSAVMWPISESPVYLYSCVTWLHEPSWILVPPDQYQVVGGNMRVDIAAAPDYCFYRLQWP